MVKRRYSYEMGAQKVYNRKHFLVFGLCGFSSLIFQFIGLLAPAWLVADTNIIINGALVSENARLGLFWGYECEDTGLRKECKWFSMENLYNTIQQSERTEISKSATETFITNFVPIKILTLTACIGSIIAKIMVIPYTTSTIGAGKRCLCAIGVTMWFASGILLGAAVVYYTSQFFAPSPSMVMLSTIIKYSDQMEQKILFPWCMAMTGLGALFAILTALLVCKVFCLSTNEYAGTWKTFRILEEWSGLVDNEKSHI